MRAPACLTIAMLLATLLSGCGSTSKSQPGTLGDLFAEPPAIAPEPPPEVLRAEAVRSYQAFVEAAGQGEQHQHASRRLADLILEESQDRLASTEAQPADGVTLARSVAIYTQLLRDYPEGRNNDLVLYQLARAYESNGQLEEALTTLDTLVLRYRSSAYYPEAQFRRGEILFAQGEYEQAQEAYQAVTLSGAQNDFYDKALYKHGWTLFRQANYEGALNSFFQVLETMYARQGASPDKVAELTPNDRDLFEDTLRVISLSFTYLGGAPAVDKFFDDYGARGYEARVYQNLADLYLEKKRIRDAADTYLAFVKRYPSHPLSPKFEQQVIEAYKTGGFASLLLPAKEEFVEHYGVNSAFWHAQDGATRTQLTAYLIVHITDLAKHYHAVAQKEKTAEAYDKAARWYAEFLTSFPNHPEASEVNFLYAESLFEAKRYEEAVYQYERTAYKYPTHAKSAEAGYAALLTYQRIIEGIPEKQTTQRAEWQEKLIVSSLSFGDVFPTDKRSGAVLSAASDTLFEQKRFAEAIVAANKMLALQPPVDTEKRYSGYTIVGHSHFDLGQYAEAELAYQEALKLLPQNDKRRPPLVERLASSIYKQGESYSESGDHLMAASQYLRVGQSAPGASIVATAEYDAATSFILVKDWGGAIGVLERFRRNYPNHQLQDGATEKLALAYSESGQSVKAAGELVALSAVAGKDSAYRRDALWNAAEIYEKNGQRAKAAELYQQFVKQFPSPAEQSIEARQRLATISKDVGNEKAERYWLEQIIEADRLAGNERTDRTRYLGAQASLTIGQALYTEFSQARLTSPLQQSLKVKKARMESALKVFASAADYQLAEATTAATYHIGKINQDFARALMESERPAGLNAEELEQYDILLEEQAYPFEETATELYETNVARIKDGIYDKWVRLSLEALSKLSPVRYAKSERQELYFDALQ